ncbi:twin-arginine translocase subunit TatC [Gulosibacter faecalis]|uniref:Sec-independent protein translocase protein TatC n=1 Tax=Gulosibacter faecalis TaxID=272240 RepID=A0ABW5UZ06_9MICO|nr:twin-arginine translocase subunit TatC [Gulosibacter faecalis]
MTTLATPAAMPLAGHLREARKRATRAAIALVAGMVVGYFASDAILEVLRQPILELAESGTASLNYSSVTGAFDLKLQIALTAGIVLSSPVWLYELFAYVAPGLHRREKKYLFGFLAAAVPLFALGCATALAVFPRVVELLTGFASTEDTTLLAAADYVEFVLRLVIAMGVAYALPVLLVVLNFMGVLSSAALAHSWRWVIVAIVLFSALITPAADALSMFAVAVPMTALFLAALGITHLQDRRLAKKGS